MKYLPLRLVALTDTGQKDALGNAIREEQTIITADGRFSSWTAADMAVLGAEITKFSRKIVTRAVRADCASAAYAVFDSEKFTITGIKDTGRWRILIVKKFRG